jgi:hypothetical protein
MYDLRYASRPGPKKQGSKPYLRFPEYEGTHMSGAMDVCPELGLLAAGPLLSFRPSCSKRDTQTLTDLPRIQMEQNPAIFSYKREDNRPLSIRLSEPTSTQPSFHAAPRSRLQYCIRQISERNQLRTLSRCPAITIFRRWNPESSSQRR